jgi:hypothetical protein
MTLKEIELFTFTLKVHAEGKGQQRWVSTMESVENLAAVAPTEKGERAKEVMKWIDILLDEHPSQTLVYRRGALRDDMARPGWREA